MKIDNRQQTPGRMRAITARVLLASMAFQVVAPAGAAVPTLSTVPLATYSPEPPRVNLMFILDDSSSMNREYVPEDKDGNAQFTGKCFGYHELNKIFYNPATYYEPPPKADFVDPVTSAASFAPPSDYTKVPVDGFDLTAGTKNLSSGAPVWSAAGSGANGTFYWTTYAKSIAPTNCSTAVANDLTRVTTWAQVVATPPPQVRNSLDTLVAAKYADGTAVTSQSNYAVWYAFYRNRLQIMRSATGLVLRDVDASKFRVGFSTINEAGAVDNAKFHNVADFDKLSAGSTTKKQRQVVLEKLYTADTATYTPLRPALSKAGRYYGNKLTGQRDPIQYHCQKNYTILTTDGYWNTAAEPSGFKGLQLNGAAFVAATGDSGQPAPFGDSFSYTLADIAYYYNNTDLRADFPNPKGPQTMVTYTLGLGVTGELPYNPAYTDDQMKLVTWPDPLTSSNSNTVVTRIDDLWHAAVNGRGRYYSAANPDQVVTSLRQAFDGIKPSAGSAAAANISSLTPAVGGGEQVFVPSAERRRTDTEDIGWRGDVRAYPLVVKSGSVVLPDTTKDTPTWSAQQELDKGNARTIKYNKGGALVDFVYNTMDATTMAYFDNRCAAATPAASKLSQCAALPTGAAANVTGKNLVDYLRGAKTHYQSSTTATDRLFRTRKSILGDIVNSSPVFVSKPSFLYTDDGYTAFKESNAKRAGRVYVGANDGMLHAFDGNTGSEVWAFIPTKALPNLWNLADANYDANHRAYVDGPVTLADVKINGAWRTVLVAGMGAGGNEFFALDVTDPNTPKLLWEFTDAQLGLAMGEPIVTKMKDGKWVAIFTSGYNNVVTGSGNGFLYVVDIATGTLVRTIPTTGDGGSKTTPSNLARINAYIASDTNNTATRIYGGDMLGNLWRFDFDDRLPPDGNEAMLMGQARDASGKIQPITSRPLVTKYFGKTKVEKTLVSFGTGKYLNAADLNAEPTGSIYGNQQSLYVVVDKPNTASLGVLRSTLQNLPATVGGGAVDLNSRPGFYMDLPNALERVNIDPLQFNGVLSFATSIPLVSDPCDSGGKSNLYFFNVLDAGQLTALEGLKEIVVGGGRIFNPDEKNNPGDGSNGGKLTWTTPSGVSETPVGSPKPGGGGSSIRRAGWRELVD